METIKNGLLVEKFSEILVKSHSRFKTSRLKKLEARAEFWDPMSLLTKFSGISMRVISSIFEFLIRIGFVKKSEIKFRMFSDIFEGLNDVKNLNWSEYEDISWTLRY